MQEPRDRLLAILFLGSLLAFLFAALDRPLMKTVPTRSKVSRVRGDQRALSTSIEAYAARHGVLPPMIPLGEASPDSSAVDAAGISMLSTLPLALELVPDPRDGRIADIRDPFAPEKGLPFAYFTDGKGWIVISAGPDMRHDIVDPASVYDGSLRQPSTHLLAGGPWTYDATNGMVSAGDIWRVRDVEGR